MLKTPLPRWGPDGSGAQCKLHPLELGSLLGLIHATGTVLVPLRNAATVGTGLAFSLRHVAQVLSLPRMAELSTEVPAYSGEKAWPVCSSLCREMMCQDMSLLAAESAFWEEFGVSEHLMSAPHFLASLLPVTYVWVLSL